MKLRNCVVGLLLLPTWALAEVEGTSVGSGVGAKKIDALNYSEAHYSKGGSDKVTQRWYGAQSNGLKASVSEDQKLYDVQLNTSVGELLDAVTLKNHWLNKIQLEARSGSGRPGYGLVGVEAPVTAPITLFAAGAYNSGSGSWRPIAGPIWYWGKSHSMLLLHPTPRKEEAGIRAIASAVFRNRIREFGPLWADIDLSYKLASVDGKLKNRLGYGAAVGLWKFSLGYKVIPYYEGSALDQTGYHVGYAYNM